MGEQTVHGENFLTIRYYNPSWTNIWGFDLYNSCGLLYLPSCWVVPSWYLLFQGLDTLVAKLLDCHDV